jgi:hypothetical protein
MAEIVMRYLKHINIYKHIALAFLGIFGSIIILTLTIEHGAGMTPDSVVYISVARNLADSNNFLTYNGTDLVLQPPLYPLILASLKKITSIDPQISTIFFNAFVFGFIIYLSGLFLLKYLNSFVLIFLGTISVLISYALVQISLMVLSEPLFILLTILFLYHLDKFRSKQDYTSLLLLSLWASLACLTRYSGVILILTGFIFILIQHKSNLKEKFLQSLFFILITVLPIGSWIIRNYFISETPFGQRAESSYTLLQNLGFFYDTVLLWYLPANSIITYLMLFVFIGAGWILYKLNFDKPFNFKIIDKIFPSVLFVILYSCIILITSTTTAYDRISDRLLSPIYIPSVFILFFVLDKTLKWLSMYFNKYAVSIFFTIGVISLLRFPLHNTLYILDEFRIQSGVGYNSDEWKNSETIEFLLRHKKLVDSHTLYSNEPEAVYVLTNLKIEYSPAKTFYNSPQQLNTDQNNKTISLNGKNGILIWFDNANRDFLFTIKELQKSFDMTEVESFDDGEIYTFN